MLKFLMLSVKNVRKNKEVAILSSTYSSTLSDQTLSGQKRSLGPNYQLNTQYVYGFHN